MPQPIALAGPYNIKAEHGSTLSFGVVRKDHKKRILPMVDFTAVLQVKNDSGEVLLELTTENGGLEIDGPRALTWVYATDTQIDAIPVGKYVYKLKIIYPTVEAEKETLIKGSFTVDP